MKTFFTIVAMTLVTSSAMAQVFEPPQEFSVTTPLPGAMTGPVTLYHPSEKTRLLIADVNNDGYLDLIYTTEGGGDGAIHVREGTKTGAFRVAKSVLSSQNLPCINVGVVNQGFPLPPKTYLLVTKHEFGQVEIGAWDYKATPQVPGEIGAWFGTPHTSSLNGAVKDCTFVQEGSGGFWQHNIVYTQPGVPPGWGFLTLPNPGTAWQSTTILHPFGDADQITTNGPGFYVGRSGILSGRIFRSENGGYVLAPSPTVQPFPGNSSNQQRLRGPGYYNLSTGRWWFFHKFNTTFDELTEYNQFGTGMWETPFPPIQVNDGGIVQGFRKGQRSVVTSSQTFLSIHNAQTRAPIQSSPYPNPVRSPVFGDINRNGMWDVLWIDEATHKVVEWMRSPCTQDNDCTASSDYCYEGVCLPPCTTSAQCENSPHHVDGTFGPVVLPTPGQCVANRCTPRCAVDPSVCPMNTHCNIAEDRCIDNCDSDTDCSAAGLTGYSCVGGPGGTCESGCVNDSQCSPGTCLFGQCANPCDSVGFGECVAGAECSTIEGQCRAFCSSSKDCVIGTRCNNDGVCEDLSYLQPFTPPASRIVPVDLNVDGLMDFLVVNTQFSTSEISLLENKATDPGTFKQRTITTSEFLIGDSYSDVAVGDCDRDGIPDILIGLTAPTPATTEVIALRSSEYDPGTQLYNETNAGRAISPSYGVESIHVADFDGDGNLDLAVMPKSGLISVFQGDGDCNFSLRWTSGQSFMNSPMVVGNVDGFPGSELVVGQGNNLYIYQFNRKTWSFELPFVPMSNAPSVGSSLLRLGNVVSNGNLEIIVVGNFDTQIYSYEPLIDPNVLQELHLINEGGITAAVGNVRGSRQNELVIGWPAPANFGTRFSSLGVYDSIDGLVDRAYTENSILFGDVAIVDVTGDRLPDIVAFTEGLGLTIFPGKADLYGPPEDLGGTAREFLDIKLADIDRDGTLDLYYLATGSSFFGWRAGPTLDSSTETGSSVSEDYQSFAIADLNSDGRMDVVFFSTVSSQKSHRAMGTGTGFGSWESLPFDVESVGSPTPQPVSRTVGVVGAFDASGRPEFYVGNSDGSDYLLRHDPDVLRELNANSTWRGATAARTHVAAAGDITGDGFTDVVIGGVHATEQTARWLKSDGNGNFSNEYLPPLGGATQTGVALADFDNDGLLDIVFAQTGEPNVVLLQGASNSFTSIDWQSPPHLPNTEQTTDVAAVDLNSDGYLDLVFTSKDGDAIQIFFNNGDPANFGFYSAQVFPGGDWEAVAAGDVDNDGDIDLIVAPTNGTLHLLQNLLYVEPGVSDTGLLTNQPTTAVVYRPGSPPNLEDGGTGRPVTGEVDVPVLLRDAESDFANLIMEYRSVGSSVWVEFADQLRLNASPAGVTHLIPWNTAGLPVGEYELRATVIQTPTVGTTAIGSTIAMSPKVRVGGCLPVCLTGEVCVGTTCQPVCALSADCGLEGCYGESFCAPTDPVDAEADVDCLPGYENDGVDCVPTCIDNDDCTAPNICFPTGCLDPSDLCAHVNCLEGFSCLAGECVLDLGECTENSDCDPSAPVCYVSGGVGVCATADLCELVDCPLGYSCTLGTCFSDPACVPPEIEYPGFGCGPPPGGGDSPCDGVICPIGQTCILGGGVGISCEPICSQDADCLEPGHVCYNGEFCGPPNLCGGLVDCPPNFGCSGGGCHPICTSDADCEDPLVCADELCRNVSEPCNGIFCSEFQACYLGSCHPICDDSGDCNPPYSYCMNSQVCLQAYDLCEGLICPFGMACHQGQCVLSCSDTDPCVAPYSCYTEVCAENDCDLTCPDGMGCYQQGCHTVCDDTDDCAFYDVCHTSLITPVGPDRCALEPCGNVFCLLGEACYGGVCYPFCGADGSCDDPDHVCYNNEICLPADPCEGIYCPVGQTCFGGDCRLACSLNNDCPGFVGTARFTNVAEQVGLATPWSKNAGVAWGDFNNDGCLDLALNTNSSEGRSRLYKSDCSANPLFTDISHTVLPIDGSGNSHFLKYSRDRSIAWGDFNNDGYLDLARNSNTVIEVYLNTGPPLYTLESEFSFTIPSAGPGRSAMNSEGMGWIDFDGDGYLDLFAEDEEYGVLMYQNSQDGNLNFVEVDGLTYPAVYDRNGDFCSVADINLDSHVDILCRKPNHGLILASDLFLNKGDGTFNNTGGALFNQPASNSNKGGTTICDVNNDGLFDIIWTDNGDNQIWLQRPGGVFKPTGEPEASSGFVFPSNKMNDVLCGDVDHDGRNDLFWIGEEGSFLFLNRSTGGGLSFEAKNLGITSTSEAYSGAMADYNRDGSLDILVHASPRNELWKNPRSDNRYLMIRALVDLEALAGEPAGTVRDGIGASVVIQNADDEILGLRAVSGARGRGSQDPAIMHYGLPYGANVPYKLTVVWPHGARVTKCVVPSTISGYQLINIKDTDADDTAACSAAGDWRSLIEPADLGEPQEYCFDGTCASSACEGVTCLKGFTCYGGVCEPDCPSASCGLACIGDACVPDACNSDKFICPVGYACTNGLCEPECTADSDCTADQQCYQGTCNPATCDSVVCPAGQNCHQGICFDDCSDCLAPNICVKDRCVPNHCAALDDEFDDDYIFRKAGGHVSATRHSLPWFWPDPFVGSSFSTWAGLSGNSVTNTDVPALHTARVSLYLDQSHSSGSHSQGRYVLWFNQGAAHGDQRPAQASYRVRVDGVEPELLLNDDNESWEIIDTDMDDYYVFQAHVTSGSGETGGVAIGRFGSSDSTPWFISIDADFAGDIRRWEWVNADGSVIELDPKETLTLSISSPDGKYYSPAAGRTCSTGLKGICQRGTSYCEQGERRCTPTVLPWAFEICDGLDNNCNGDIDEPDNMRFPGVEWRDDVTSWQLLTTMDKSDAVQSTMNFVPEGTDDRVGSTNLVSSDGSPIQAWNRAVIAMHRDLTTGSLSMLIANGLRETGASMNGIGDYDIETRLSFPGSNTAEEMFPAWWDDRLPADDGDEITENFRLDRMDLEWELRQGGMGSNAWREADTLAMMTRWSGATLALRELEARYRWTEDNNNSSAPKHLSFGLHQPGQDFRTISRTRTVQVRVTPQRQEDTACWSNGLTTVGGCGLGFYQCAVGGVLSCGEPTDAACDRCVDADGDGYAAYDEITCPTGRDCDDSDPSIHPGAHEQCNGRDSDCDGLIDIKDDQAYFDRWGEVRPSGAASCPVGADNCGPQECQFRNVCVCPDGPEDPTDPPSQPCFCGEGLAAPPADESAVCSMP